MEPVILGDRAGDGVVAGEEIDEEFVKPLLEDLVDGEVADFRVGLAHQSDCAPFHPVGAGERAEAIAQRIAAESETAREAVVEHHEFDDTARLRKAVAPLQMLQAHHGGVRTDIDEVADESGGGCHGMENFSIT